MNEKINKLLLENLDNSIVVRLDERINSAISFDYVETDPIPLKNVIDIYSFRTRWWREKKRAVEGADSLVVSLGAAPSDVVIVRFTFTDESYVVFTDRSFQQLRGIICAPRAGRQK